MIITKKFAQSFVTSSQLLTGQVKGGDSTAAIIDQIGYVQIDTISVIERAHHHVLWSRNEKYTPEALKQLEEEKGVFEYWAHAASYLPIKDYHFSLVPKQQRKKGKGHWQARNKKIMKNVHDQFKAEGPLMSKDFKKDPKLKYDHAWGGHPVTSAIRQLFMEGEIMISGRKGFQKIYDITQRVLPTDVNQNTPTLQEYFTYLIMRDLKANGLMTPVEIGHLISIPKPTLSQLLASLCEEGILIKVEIKSVAGAYYAIKDQLENHRLSKQKKKVKILSPFDNLLINRKRTQALFDFDYTLECYVPAKKRKVGYFSLPLLYGAQLIGQVDIKADRKTKELNVKNLVWNEQINTTATMKNEVSKSLDKFRLFNGCDHIVGLSKYGL